MIWSILLGLAGLALSVSGHCHQPHILYIMADDLGWRDVSWNAEDMYTPNLERMKDEGVYLNNNYMQAACSASRIAFLTGYNAYRMGYQRNEMAQAHRWRNLTLSPDVKILPEYLRCQGYSTHLVGKWQMGFCNWDMTPTRRGFETFYGSYGGNSGHYNHTPDVGGYDMRDNLNVDWAAEGQYSTSLYTDRTEKIIRDHHACGDNRPLFIHLSYEAPHVPLEAPNKYINRCAKKVGATGDRLVRCAMMAAIDDGVQQVVDVLEELEYDDNLLVVFASDNGAPGSGGASNWPYRGKKRGVYEGGMKVPAFLWSKTLLPNKPYAYNGLFHATDWVPTLLRVAGAQDVESILPEDKDGYDQWRNIRRNEASARVDQTTVLDLDEAEGVAALRWNQWKLVKDTGYKEKCFGWFNPPAGVDTDLPKKTVCEHWSLYNLEQDPYETTNVWDQEKDIANNLKKEYYKARGEVLVNLYTANVTESFPENWGGAWSPGWC